MIDYKKAELNELEEIIRKNRQTVVVYKKNKNML